MLALPSSFLFVINTCSQTQKSGRKRPFFVIDKNLKAVGRSIEEGRDDRVAWQDLSRAQILRRRGRGEGRILTSHGAGSRACSGYPNIRSSGCLLRPMDIRSSGCRGGGIHMSFVEVRPAASGGIGPSHSSFTTTNQLLISASVELFWLIIAQQS